MADLEEFRGLDEAAELRAALRRTQKQLSKAKAKTEELVDAAFEGAKDAMLALGPVKVVPVPKFKAGTGKPEVALWHLTDWQGAKVTATYNSQVMRERVMAFCEKAEKITAVQRADHPVNDCVVAFGGDHLEGLFNYPTQPFEIDATLFEQVVTVARLEADVVRRALAAHPGTVKVRSKWGNHGRVGAKRAVVPGRDNLDRFAFALAREQLAGEKRLEWVEEDADVQKIEVGNYRAALIHGDEVGRHGFASPATIVQHVARWKSGAYPWAFRDLLLGHYHNHQEWQLPDGEGSVYMTGATESDNRYARTLMAASAQPSQRLHFVDPRKGHVTAQYRVRLDG